MASCSVSISTAHSLEEFDQQEDQIPDTFEPETEPLCSHHTIKNTDPRVNNTKRFEDENEMTANYKSDSQVCCQRKEQSYTELHKTKMCQMQLKRMIDDTKPLQATSSVADLQEVISESEQSSVTENGERISADKGDSTKRQRTSLSTKMSAAKLLPVKELPTCDYKHPNEAGCHSSKATHSEESIAEAACKGMSEFYNQKKDYVNEKSLSNKRYVSTTPTTAYDVSINPSHSLKEFHQEVESGIHNECPHTTSCCKTKFVVHEQSTEIKSTDSYEEENEIKPKTDESDFQTQQEENQPYSELKSATKLSDVDTPQVKCCNDKIHQNKPSLIQKVSTNDNGTECHFPSATVTDEPANKVRNNSLSFNQEHNCVGEDNSPKGTATTRTRSVSINLPLFSKETGEDSSRLVYYAKKSTNTDFKMTRRSTTTDISKYKPCDMSKTLSDSESIDQTKKQRLKAYTKRMKLDECTPGTSPLHLASMKGLLEAVKVLVVEFEFDPNVRDTNYQATPLHHAAQNGHTDIIKYFINVRICDPEVKDMNGLTPLHYASRKGHVTVVKSLCNDHNCNPEAKDNQQQTALHYACHFGHKNIVEFLDRTKGCNLEILDGEMRTPLHFACEFRHHEIVCYLVHKKMCNTNAQDIRGRTPLHYACIWWKRVKYDDDKNLSCKILKELLSDPECDVNRRTKDGNTALHLACNTDRLNSVCLLLSKPGCNPNGRNNAGQTPLQLTSHLDVIEELISKGANPMLSVLYKWQKLHDLTTPCTCLNSWSTEEIRELTRSGMKPMELFTWLIEQINEDKALEAIQSIIENTSWNFNTLFRNGCNALHLACKANKVNILECLLVKGKCNPNIKTKTGCTPLQLSSDRSVIKHLLQNQADPTDYLRSLMFKKQERYLLDIMKYLTEDAKWQIDIALLLACEANQPKVVQFLLAEKECNPNAVNSSKRSPLQLTSISNPDIIKLLLRYGANPVDVYKFHSKILGTKQPLRPSVKVFIVGDPSVGKSSLTAALQDEPFIEMLSRPRKVSGVNEKTAGVIPYEVCSRKYGRITLYDFAGQRDYYGSHAALLCNAIQSSPPIFLLVVNLNEDNEIIKQTIIYWISFIDNQCTSVDSQPHIIIIGSHADILLERKEDPEEKRHIVEEALKDHLPNMKFVGFITMNCSYANTPEMRKLRSFMKESILLVKSQSISFSAHCFQVYLIDKFRDQVAVQLKDIQKQVQSDCGTKHDDTTFTSFIPTNIKDLCIFCKELSDQGHNLFLNNPLKPEDGWIIIDKSLLLNEVTGSIFAPASFKEHINLASSTGVVPFTKIKDHFSCHDPEMIVGYLSHLEFCHEVSDYYILRLLDKDKTCLDSERHFFFSGLVTLNIPKAVWKPKPQQFSYHCGWILQCKKQGGFFIPRFFEVLLLRLAFSFALARSPNETDDSFPAIQRECSVWKNGIFWGSKHGPEVLVEICSSKAIIVLMRCEDIHLIECMQYRPKIMTAVLQCAKKFCPKVQTQDFFLAPSEITEYPLVEKSLAELTRYSIEEIAHTSITSGEKTNLVCRNATISVLHLLRLEPYAVLNKKLLQTVLQDGSKTVSDSDLDEITKCGCDNALFINMFDSRQRIRNSEENLKRALVKWRDECGGTFYHLQQRLSQFSIFAGREANIYEMASIHKPEEDKSPSSRSTLLSSTDSDMVEDNSATSPLESNTCYTVNPGVPCLNQFSTDFVDCGTSRANVSFDKDGKPSLQALQSLDGKEGRKLRIVDTVASKWEELAIALGFDENVIAYVSKDYVHDSVGATLKILGMWLGEEYDDLKGPISWSTLLECLIEIGFSTISDEVQEVIEIPPNPTLVSFDL